MKNIYAMKKYICNNKNTYAIIIIITIVIIIIILTITLIY